MDWNYNMDECPLDTRVRLLTGDDCLLLPQREYVGTITDNGRFKTRGECYEGDPDYFYRSKIVAWKPHEESEVIEEILDINVNVRTNKGVRNIKFTNLIEPKIEYVHTTKDNMLCKGTFIHRDTKEKYKQIIFDCCDFCVNDLE